MSVTVSTLLEAAHAANSQTTVYTSAAGVRTIIDKFSGYGTAAATLTVNVVPSGGAAAAGNVLAAKTFAIGEAYTFPEIVGHVLEPGDFISIIASAATSIVARISGRKVT